MDTNTWRDFQICISVSLNTRIYNLISSPLIICFLAVVARKRENVEQIFGIKQVNTSCKEQMTTAKLLHKHFSYL